MGQPYFLQQSCMQPLCISALTHILENLVEFEDKWAGIGGNHEKKEFNIGYLSNLITACFRAELNSGR